MNLGTYYKLSIPQIHILLIIRRLPSRIGRYPGAFLDYRKQSGMQLAPDFINTLHQMRVYVSY